MTDEALRLLSLPFKTFSEETIGGAEQMGQGINAVRRGEPGSAAWNLGVGGLRAIGAPITAATRLLTDPASRLIQSATGIDEPTREMIQSGGDILGGAALPAGIGAVRGMMGAPGGLAARVGRAIPAIPEGVMPASSVKSLPWPRTGEIPLAKGHIRLYRGEGPHGGTPTWKDPEMAQFQGRWFTPNRELAQSHVRDIVGEKNAQLLFVDVPDSVYKSSLTGNRPELARFLYGGADDAATALLSPEWSARAIALQPSLSEARMAGPLVKEIASGADEAVARLAAIDPNKGRLFRYVTAALEDGTLAPEGVMQVMGKYNLTAEEFSRFYADTVSVSGRTLNTLSQLRRRLGTAFKDEPGALEILGTLTTDTKPSVTQRVLEGWRTFDNMRRAMLVTQWTTAIRNGLSQGARYTLDAADTALAGAFEGKPMRQAMQDGLENFTAVVHRMSPKGRAALGRILDDFPVEAQQLTGTISGEAALTSRFSNFINPLNKAQEGFYRTISFDSKLRQLAREGKIDLDAIAAKDIPPQMIEAATRHALDITFSAPPTSSVGKAILQAYHDIPGLTTINPFPRFHLNALKFLWDFSPVRMFTPGALNTIATGTPKEAAAIISKGLTGQAMLATAMAVRSSDLAGQKWYDLRVPGTNKFVDTRAFGPFNVYLLFAEGMLHPDKLDLSDWAKGLVGINRVAGTGLVLTDALQSGNIEQKRDTFYRFVGEYFGGFGVPLRNFKSTIESVGTTPFAEQERVIRTRRDFPRIDPTLGNVPGVSQALPEMRSMFQGGTLKAEFPATRQFTGLSVRRKNLAEQEAERLGLSVQRLAGGSGIPAWDRAVSAQLGPLVEQVLPQVIASEGYDRQSPDLKRFAYVQIVRQLRQQAITLAAAQEPRLAAQARLEGLDPDLRKIAGIGQKGTFPGVAEDPSLMDQLRQRLGARP